VPEGFVLFETPNPENLRVGSCDFYTDPTHINPIPPATLAFLISNSGFPIMETMRLSADSLDLGQDVSLPLRAVAASYYAARDYGIFAFKSSGDI
jgi:O-antigen chain-terminating methyltransferase